MQQFLNKNKTSILLTGGAGFIGSHVAVELLENKQHVVVIDNFSNSDPSVISQIEKITNKKITLYEGDIMDQPVLNNLFETYKIDTVIHCAGKKSVGESTKLPLSYYENNVSSSIKLFQTMEKYGVFNCVFSSSASVYGNPDMVPISEESPLKPTNPYATTKYFIEQILRDLCAANSNWKVAILRYFNPAGAHKSGLIGETPIGEPNNLFPHIMQVATGQQEKLFIFGDDYPTTDGTGVRDYIHVSDLAVGHLNAMQSLQKNKGCQTYNLGTGYGYSVLDIIKMTEKITGKKIAYEIVGRRLGDIDQCYANPQRAKEQLNWQAKQPLDKMVEDSWRWQRSLTKKNLSRPGTP